LLLERIMNIMSKKGSLGGTGKESAKENKENRPRSLNINRRRKD
jgi:hypothetical protein